MVSTPSGAGSPPGPSTPPPVVAERVDGAAAADPALRAELLRLWVDVTNAGGAVGFVPPVGPADVEPALERSLDAVRRGGESALVLREGERVVAVGYLRRNEAAIMRHWAWVVKLMVDPARQGRGLGLRALRELHAHALDLGLEAVRLTARGGLGLEAFYARAGYVEVGRVPRAIRVGPGDDRDDVVLLHELDRPLDQGAARP